MNAILDKKEQLRKCCRKVLPPLQTVDCVLLSVETIDHGPSDMQDLMCGYGLQK